MDNLIISGGSTAPGVPHRACTRVRNLYIDFKQSEKLFMGEVLSVLLYSLWAPEDLVYCYPHKALGRLRIVLESEDLEQPFCHTLTSTLRAARGTHNPLKNCANVPAHKVPPHFLFWVLGLRSDTQDTIPGRVGQHCLVAALCMHLLCHTELPSHLGSRVWHCTVPPGGFQTLCTPSKQKKDKRRMNDFSDEKGE